MKLCPTCDKEFEDSLTRCPDDDTPLVAAGKKNNPRLPGVRQVDSDAHTAMFTLEDMQKEKERLSTAAEAGEEDEEPATDEPDVPAGPPDPNATRTITPDDLERMKAERDAQKDETLAAAAGTPSSSTRGQTRTTAARDKTSQDKAPVEKTQKRPPATSEQKEGRSRALLWVLLSILAVALVGGAVTVWLLFIRKVPLEIVTTPPGAAVLLDGVELGVSPLTAHVQRGAHAVKARLGGYLETAEVVDVKEAQSLVLPLKKDLAAEKVAPPAEDAIKAKAEALYQEGKALLDKGRLDEAEVKFQAMAALTPDDPRVQEALADIEKRRNKGQGGGKRNGTGTGPGHKEGTNPTASGGTDPQGEDDAALSRMKPAARKKEAQRALDQARSAYDSGDLARARELLTRCLRYDPSQVQCHRVLARVYTKEDNTGKVKYHLERYLELGGADEDYKVRDWLRTH